MSKMTSSGLWQPTASSLAGTILMLTSSRILLKAFTWMVKSACTRSGILQPLISWSQSSGTTVSLKSSTNRWVSTTKSRMDQPLLLVVKNSLTSTSILRNIGSRSLQKTTSLTPLMLKITPSVSLNSGKSTLRSISWECLLLKGTMWHIVGLMARCLLYPTKTLTGKNWSKSITIYLINGSKSRWNRST